jgi:exonuclease VII large subunit
MRRSVEVIWRRHEASVRELSYRQQMIAELDPARVLARGYAIIRGNLTPGQVIAIEKGNITARAEVTHVEAK